MRRARAPSRDLIPKETHMPWDPTNQLRRLAPCRMHRFSTASLPRMDFSHPRQGLRVLGPKNQTRRFAPCKLHLFSAEPAQESSTPNQFCMRTARRSRGLVSQGKLASLAVPKHHSWHRFGAACIARRERGAKSAMEGMVEKGVERVQFAC